MFWSPIAWIYHVSKHHVSPESLRTTCHSLRVAEPWSRNMDINESLSLLNLYTPSYLLKQKIQRKKWNQTERNWTETSPQDNSRRIEWSLLA